MTVYTAGSDAQQRNCPAGKSPATGGIVNLSTNPMQLGSHGSGDCWVGGARFTGIAETSIASALFSMVADASYASGGTVRYIVSCHDIASPGAFTSAGDNDLEAGVRPRTTADGTLTASSVTGGTRYSVDITGAVQEVMALPGFAGTIVVLIDTHTDTTDGEWQDWRSVGAATSGDEAQLDLTASGGGSPVGPLIDGKLVGGGILQGRLVR